jgi:predicted PurR-regulated permease PerM
VNGAVPLARRTAPLVLVLALAAILFFAFRVAGLFLLLFVSLLMALYLAAATDLAVRRVRLPRSLGLVLAIVGTLAALTGVALLVAPPVLTQTQDLVTSAPRYVADLDRTVAGWTLRFPLLARAGVASPDSGVVSILLRDGAAFVRHGILPTAAATGLLLIEGVAVLVMAVYLAVQPTLYQEGLLALVPPRHRSFARAIAQDVVATLRSWIGAQLFDMIVLAVLTGLGLWLLRVPFWLAFAIFTGVVALIPFFGTLFSTVLPALLVLPERGILGACAVASIGVVVHLVEANLVAPLVMHRRVALPPVLTILSVLIGAEVAGVLGMVVAVPALATVVVLVRHLLIHRTYGEYGTETVVLPPAVLRVTREHRVPSAAGAPHA